MNWKQDSASFTYRGKPVTRVKYTIKTPLGMLRAFEATNGRIIARWPIIVLTFERSGMEIDDNGVVCKSIEEAKARCEKEWILFRDSCFNLR